MPPPRTIRAFIVGPTCVGKTKVALLVASRLQAEIVSVDSRQIYRLLEIGTAKPSADEIALVRHHLVDRLDPRERCSAGRFLALLREVCGDLAARGATGLGVGGAGLYLDVSLGRFHSLPPANESLRRSYALIANKEGSAALHARLTAVDPETAARLAPRDLQRVTRALEVTELTGRPMSATLRDEAEHSVCPADTPIIHLSRDRADLYARIERRCSAMVEGGLPGEVRGLIESGLPADAPGMKSVGYAEWAKWVAGEWDRDTAMLHFVRNTRRYAKRQETWFRNRHPDRFEIRVQPDEESDQTAERVLDAIRVGHSGASGPRPPSRLGR
jgi:tRNA dimethylallyltransferase